MNTEKVLEKVEQVTEVGKQTSHAVKKAVTGVIKIVTTVSLTGVVMGIISVLVGGGMVYFIENTLGDVFGWSFALLGLPMIIVGMLLFFLKLQIEENIENISNLKNLLTGTNVLQTLLGLMITFSFLRTLPVVAVITIGYTVYAIVKVQKAKKILKETT